MVLEVLERTLTVHRASDGVARFSFDALCGEPLGPADYLALAARFHTILIDHIPKLRPDQSNEARRFTLLIDTLYDAKATLICSAAVAPDALYVEGDAADSFRRAASRLVEMQSAAYPDMQSGQQTHAAAK
jgi:cell division protein ZapE